jgi:hypothetical protein
MQEEGATEPSKESRQQSLTNTIAGDPDHCPMSCCNPSGTKNTAAIYDAMLAVMPPSVDHAFLPAQVVFIATGLSSHTDRGPPLSTLIAFESLLGQHSFRGEVILCVLAV